MKNIPAKGIKSVHQDFHIAAETTFLPKEGHLCRLG
jgi:hypothetical protein